MGRQLLEHPVPALKMRKKAAAKGGGLQEVGTRRRATEQGPGEGLA